MKSVITVLGTDKVGIIAKVSTLLAENSVNILDISQTIMQNVFTMIMLVDLSKSDLSVSALAELLEECGTELDVSITIAHEGIFNSMHRI